MMIRKIELRRGRDGKIDEYGRGEKRPVVVVHIDPYTKNPVRGYWYMCSQTATWITLGSVWMG